MYSAVNVNNQFQHIICWKDSVKQNVCLFFSHLSLELAPESSQISHKQ